MSGLPPVRIAVTTPRSRFAEKEATMVPILLWILGVPGLIILLLLILGIVRF
jgi:hypothetical protein